MDGNIPKYVKVAIALVLIGSITLEAYPFKDWSWINPTQYENDFPIPPEDDLSYRLYCGASPGGPYDLFSTLLEEPSPVNLDMGALVANAPGTYYCVSTATSSLHNTESAYSNEVNFTVLPADLGLRPKPPVLSVGSG